MWGDVCECGRVYVWVSICVEVFVKMGECMCRCLWVSICVGVLVSVCVGGYIGEHLRVGEWIYEFCGCG